jgi:cell shape-determining protein MreC
MNLKKLLSKFLSENPDISQFVDEHQGAYDVLYNQFEEIFDKSFEEGIETGYSNAEEDFYDKNKDNKELLEEKNKEIEQLKEEQELLKFEFEEYKSTVEEV